MRNQDQKSLQENEKVLSMKHQKIIIFYKNLSTFDKTFLTKFDDDVIRASVKSKWKDMEKNKNQVKEYIHSVLSIFQNVKSSHRVTMRFFEVNKSLGNVVARTQWEEIIH